MKLRTVRLIAELDLKVVTAAHAGSLHDDRGNLGEFISRYRHPPYRCIMALPGSKHPTRILLKRWGVYSQVDPKSQVRQDRLVRGSAHPMRRVRRDINVVRPENDLGRFAPNERFVEGDDIRTPSFKLARCHVKVMSRTQHEPLVSKETFLKVQKVLDHRNRKGDRDITHFHYLKGLLYCGECEDAGRRSRLVYSQNAGNGGTCEYLVCALRQHKQCSMPWLRGEQIEPEVVLAVAREGLTLEAVEGIREAVTKSIANILAEDRDVKALLTKQLKKLEAQEERLIELAATGSLPIAKIRERIEKTTLEKEVIKEKLELTVDRLQYGTETALAYIDLLREPGKLYKRASDTVRRDLLTAFFEHLTVRVDDNRIQVNGKRHAVNVTR